MLLLLLTMMAACAPGPPPEVAAAPGGVVLELDPYPLGGLLTVPVTVGDHEADFIFDTGGGGTLYTKQAARAAGCEPFGRVTGFRHGGGVIHARRCPSAPLVIDGWTSPPGETFVLDLVELLPEDAPPVGGLIALDRFDGHLLTVDLGGRRLVVDGAAVGHEVPVRESRQAGGAMLDVFLPFEAPGGPVWMELDSGNTGPTLIAPHAASQLGLELSHEEPRPVTLHLEGFGPVRVQALEREMIYDGLLSAAFLQEHTVTLDLGGGRAWITR